MLHHYADDGRVLTPPNELKTMLKGSFSAFSKLLGHIRFFYMADEIWDGKSSLVFNADGEQLTAIMLDDGVFYIHISNDNFRIADEALLDNVFEALKKTVSVGLHRPFEQLTANPDPNVFPCGYRCDLCLGSKKCDENNYSENENFGYINWVCYHHCVPNINIERWDGVFVCAGCNLNNSNLGITAEEVTNLLIPYCMKERLDIIRNF